MPDTVSPTTIPKPVKIARIVLWIQSALLIFGTILLSITVFDDLGHGQDVEPLEYFALLVTLVQAAILLWSGFQIRRGWARVLAITVESISIAGVLFTFLTAGAFSLAGLVLPAAVILLLTRPEAKNWYDAENSTPDTDLP